MSFIFFVENIVHLENNMKNLKHIKEGCFLCQGSGEIHISPDDLVICLCEAIKNCPICLGNGYLNILKAKESYNDRAN